MERISRQAQHIVTGLWLIAALLCSCRPESASTGADPAAAKSSSELAPGKPRVLMIVTSHAELGSTGEQTGIWLEELAVPYREFVAHGAHVDIASPKGGAVPVDPRSLGETADAVRWFFDQGNGEAHLASSQRLHEVRTDYDGYFVVGGHGAMWDLPASPELAKLLADAYDAGRVVSAVCHGPAALTNVRLRSGQPLVKARRVTGFSNSEEVNVKLDGVVPFALQTRLEELGAHYESRSDFAAFAIQDGNLITGQNPASSIEVARMVLKAIAASKQKSQRTASGGA